MGDPLVCYLVSNNVVTSTNQYFPCGSSDISGASAQSCCNAEDYCMEDSICHYTRGGVTNGTGYYMGGCTDPTWKDPACPKQCTSEFRPDIIYDRTNAEWRCCDSTADTLNCQSPSEFIVKAPDPEELSTIVQLSTPAPSSTAATSATFLTSIYSNPTTTSVKPAKPTKTTTTPPKHTDQSAAGISSGAKAGIAIAIITLVVLLIGAFLFFRIRSAKPRNETKKHKSLESRAIPSNPFRRSDAFTTLVSRPNSAQPSEEFQSPVASRRDSEFPIASRRDSEFPISLQDPNKAPGHKKAFSYDIDVGPYEMETPSLHQRVPYDRPLSAQELEGTRVQVQELPAHRESGLRVERGLGIETPDDNSDAGTLDLDSGMETPDSDAGARTPDKDR